MCVSYRCEVSVCVGERCQSECVEHASLARSHSLDGVAAVPSDTSAISFAVPAEGSVDARIINSASLYPRSSSAAAACLAAEGDTICGDVA